MRSYHHFTLTERESLAKMREEGQSLRAIARAMGRHPSSISRELMRNGTKSKQGYTPYWGVTLYLQRRKKSRRKQRYETDTELAEYTKECLRKYWSPGIIVIKWKSLHPGAKLSEDTIYRALARGLIEGYKPEQYLRRRGRLKYKRGNSSPIRNERRISERPEEANERSRIGDWEGDTIWGKNQESYLLTCVDRKSRYVKAVIMKNKSSQTTNEAMKQLLGDECVHSLTLDRGAEFAGFGEMEKELDTQVFFADPHAPWQRGTNENINGLLRFFFPAKTDFLEVTQEELDAVLSLINDRPRKCLGWLSSADVFLSPCCT